MFESAGIIGSCVCENVAQAQMVLAESPLARVLTTVNARELGGRGGVQTRVVVLDEIAAGVLHLARLERPVFYKSRWAIRRRELGTNVRTACVRTRCATPAATERLSRESGRMLISCPWAQLDRDRPPVRQPCRPAQRIARLGDRAGRTCELSLGALLVSASVLRPRRIADALGVRAAGGAMVLITAEQVLDIPSPHTARELVR